MALRRYKEGGVCSPAMGILVPKICHGWVSLYSTPQRCSEKMDLVYEHHCNGFGVYVLIPSQAHLDVSKISVEVLLTLHFWYPWLTIREFLWLMHHSVTTAFQCWLFCCCHHGSQWYKTNAAYWRCRLSYFLLLSPVLWKSNSRQSVKRGNNQHKIRVMHFN